MGPLGPLKLACLGRKEVEEACQFHQQGTPPPGWRGSRLLLAPSSCGHALACRSAGHSHLCVAKVVHVLDMLALGQDVALCQSIPSVTFQDSISRHFVAHEQWVCLQYREQTQPLYLTADSRESCRNRSMLRRPTAEIHEAAAWEMAPSPACVVERGLDVSTDHKVTSASTFGLRASQAL